MWDFSFGTMKLSKHIDATLHGESWVEAISGLCARNRIYPNRVWHYPLMEQPQIYNIISNSDIGVFPNRCEGGTNLALMEYMACGKPVIASYNTGHMDILNEGNSIRLIEQQLHKFQPHPGYDAEWYEPSLDELISKIEWAYDHREATKEIGIEGSKTMRGFTWERVANQIIEVMIS
jgi:glycosyltransferase involved in cell wall biosynthesis